MTPVPDTSRSILSDPRPIQWVAVLGDGIRFEVGESGVERMNVIQEYGAGGYNTGDLWLVISGDEGATIARLPASLCVIYYGPPVSEAAALASSSA